MNKLFFAAIMLTASLHAATAQPVQENNEIAGNGRPKVGLVLAGGGAKGAAHIGAIKYIEELGIPIDYVAGTSMGSIIGGLYALGYSPDEMNEIIKSVDWSYLMGNSVPRINSSLKTKDRNDSYLISVPFGLKDLNKQWDEIYQEKQDESKLTSEGEIINTEDSPAIMKSLPSGFISGNNVVNLFNDLSIGYQDSIDFRDLPIPYACVTTNMLDGSQAVLKSGRIAYAMRSSMAIPIVFAPTEYNNMLLVDGGMVNNFPTDVCREMGADIIIGVELSKGFKADRSQVESMPGMLSQLMAIVTSGHNAENRKLCDSYIRPDVSGYGTMSFDAESIDSLVNRGYAEAQKCSEELLAIKERVEMNGPVPKKLHAPKAIPIDQLDSIVLSNVTFNGVSDYDAHWMSRKWELSTNKKVTADDIRTSISKYMGTGSYDRIAYNTIADPDSSGKYHLDLLFKESEPHRFSIGLRGDTEEAVTLGLNIGFNENKLSGFSASLGGVLSYYPFLKAKLTYAFQGIINVNLSYDFRRSKFHSIFDETDFRGVTGNSHRHRVRLSLSEFNARFIHAEGGVEYEAYSYNTIMEGVRLNVDSLNRNAGLFLNFMLDNRDDPYYADRGIKASLNGRYRFFTETIKQTGLKLVDKIDSNGDIYGSFEGYITPGDGPITIIPQLYHRSVFGNYDNISMINIFGGTKTGRYIENQIPYIGLNSIYTSNFRNLTIGRCDIRWHFLQRHYLTGMVNYLETSERISDYFNDTIADNGYPLSYGFLGAGLRYTYASKIGPMSLDVHWSQLSKKVGLYLSVGYDF